MVGARPGSVLSLWPWDVAGYGLSHACSDDCMGWGCALVGGIGFGMWLGLGVCYGSQTRVGFLGKMSCWIRWICAQVLQYFCLNAITVWG